MFLGFMLVWWEVYVVRCMCTMIMMGGTLREFVMLPELKPSEKKILMDKLFVNYFVVFSGLVGGGC